jgi:hypothetical protein
VIDGNDRAAIRSASRSATDTAWRNNEEHVPMRVPTWRLALGGGAVIVLIAAGIGLVAASNAPAAPVPNVAAADPTTGPASSARPGRPDGRKAFGEHRGARGARLLRLGRHLVHVEETLTDRDGQLVVVWLDHGTVQSVADGKVTLSEAGGTSQTISTDDATIVRLGHTDGTLKDVTVGAEVFVQSRVVGGHPVAKRILIIPTPAT